MTNPVLKGIRIIELGVWVAGPAAGGLLADWGADVIKVEPPSGDPQRHVLRALGLGGDRVPPFEMDNRGKRSVVIDLNTPEGQKRMQALLKKADVLITNVRQQGLTRLGLTPDIVMAEHPSLIYGLLTGYGMSGPDSERAGYDVGAFWSRAGVNTRIVPHGHPPPNIPPAFGDHMSAISLVAGICAALVRREKTGQGGLVDTSLLRTGIYGLGADFAMQLHYGKLAPRSERTKTPAPLVNCYKTSDGHWIWLLGVESDRHWPRLLKALNLSPLLQDERFENARARYKNRVELIAELDKAFATMTREAIASQLDKNDVWWAPVQTVEDVIKDPQAIASEAFVDIPSHDNNAPLKSVAGPVNFDGITPVPQSPSPQLGEHSNDDFES